MIDLRLQICCIRGLLRDGLVIQAYEKLQDLELLNEKLLKEERKK